MRIILLLLLFVGHLAQSQELIEPLELSKQIFSKAKFKHLKKYTTGEYQSNKNHPNGTDLSPTIEVEFELLTKLEDISVVALTLVDSTGIPITDVYLHFKFEDQIWKLAAFRGLAMTGLIEQVVQMYDSLNEQQIDILINQENSRFKSRKEFDFELMNSKLTLASDRELIKHFITNQEKFQVLVNEVNQDRPEFNPMRRTPLGENQKQLTQELLIGHITDGAFDCEGCMELTIGGMIDNTVGYLYITDPKKAPKMNPNRYIMVRKLSPNWYLFKTT